jgi:tetratricopeptide (TPR) repeat protein
MHWLRLAVPLVFALAVAVWFSWRKGQEADRFVPRPPGTLTFNKDIAPILHRHCAGCHRPGEAGPFNLITYDDAKRRAELMVKVTQSRYMPPWLPEKGEFEFADARRLTADQIGVLKQWFGEGAIEGRPEDRPKPPEWTPGWQLGPPDLVVTLPAPYTLPADGRDVYRNFVLPVPLAEARFVRALEFRASTKVIHHGFIRVDRTRQSRRLDAEDAEPGFPGMTAPASVESPGGQFMTWQPGRGPIAMQEGLAWTLPPHCDLVLQLHLQPSGKPEPVQPSVGIYFTAQPPTNTPSKIALSSYAIDIPAGAKDYAVEDSYELPVDADLLAVLPHTHYLAKDIQGFALLPGGKRKELLHIKEWDFNWQTDYRYARPVFLPKGTRLATRIGFDNSAENPRNPHQPPRRVTYGVQSSDEMAELWFQLLPRTTNDAVKLMHDYQRKLVDDVIAFNDYRLRLDTNDARAHNELGKARIAQGRRDEALAHFRTALELKPDFDEAHYNLGVFALSQNNLGVARRAFAETVRLNPDHFKAHNNLGLLCLRAGEWQQAETHFRAVLRINPGDPMATENLTLLQRNRRVP